MTVQTVRATISTFIRTHAGACVVLTMAGFVAISPASAQLGKIRQAAEKAKEAATLNKEVSKSADNSVSRDYAITSDRVGVVLKVLMPLIAQAEKDVALKTARTDYEAKTKTVQTCMDAAVKEKSAGMMVPDPANAQKASQLSMRVGQMAQRMSAAQQAKRYREFIALQDSAQVLGLQSSAVMLGITKCGSMPFKPASVVDADAEQLTGKPSSSGSRKVTVEATDRGGLTYQQFGILRERMALWALQQTGDAKPGTSKYATFTDAENAALLAHTTELKKLSPYFKDGSITWIQWGDVTEW